MINCEKIPFYLNQSDDRGLFWGLVNQGAWQEVNVVTTKAGEIRGGHFHIKTHELIFLLQGKAEVELQDCHNNNDKQKLILNAGEGIKITPYIIHTFYYLEDSQQVALLDHPFDPANPDLHILSSNYNLCQLIQNLEV